MEGEELFYSYGDQWFAEWTDYLARMSEWSIERLRRAEIREIRKAMVEFKKTFTSPVITENTDVPVIKAVDREDDVSEQPMPRFLSFIGAPDSLFFPMWRDMENMTEDEMMHIDTVGNEKIEEKEEIEPRLEVHMTTSDGGHVEVEVDGSGDVIEKHEHRDVFLSLSSNLTLEVQEDSVLDISMAHMEAISQ